MGKATTAPAGGQRQDDFAERIAHARTQMGRALSLEGYAVDGRAVCPSCHTGERGKTKVFEDGGFKCHKCDFWTKNAVDFLTVPRVRRAGAVVGQAREVGDKMVLVRQRGEETTLPLDEVTLEGGKWRFTDAVAALCGADIAHPEGKTPALEPINSAPAFNADPTPELYEMVVSLGSLEAAQAFYGRWNISPETVERFRSVRITLSDKELAIALRKEFSPEQIIAGGLATQKGYLLVNERYPVIEPHLTPSGLVVGMQFRGSESVEAQVAAHKQWSRIRKAAEVAGVEPEGTPVEYTPKFLSLNGAGPEMQPGLGVANMATLIASGEASRRRIYIVEGFKDLLAGETMGLTCYGLPGAGKLPVRGVCQMLAQFAEVRVTLDGDEAGAKGRARLVEHLASHGITAVLKPPPDGQDMCDVLVARSRP